MRDRKRIPVIIDALKKVWEQYPDLRLTQLIYQLGAFHQEDDKTLAVLESMLKKP